VIPSVGPLRGGPSFALMAITRSLASEGVEVHVATTDDNGPTRLDVQLARPLTCEKVTTWHFRRQTKFYTFSWPLTRWLAHHAQDYDLVHIHSLFSYPSLVASHSAWRAGVPYVVRPLGTLNHWGMTNRRPWLKRLSFRLVERRILQGAAAVQYTSEREREEAGRLGVCHPYVVLPPGIDPILCETRPAPDQLDPQNTGLKEGKTILFLSRIDEKKGLEHLLHAFARMVATSPEAVLVVAGSGDQRYVKFLQELCRRLDIAESVRWPGFLHGEDKLAALTAARIFVLPSHSENFGIAAVEAMAAGLPVILSEHVGISEEVGENRAGLIVPCESEALAAALERLLGDPMLCQELGRNGRRLATDCYSTGATTRQLIALYERVARKSLVPAAE
jgi:glycosyltransferase involved in cell wall biosynthesis